MFLTKWFQPKPKHSRAYVAYHLSPQFAVIRARCILRCNGYCEVCHKNTAREIHLKTYASNLWKTTVDDCVATCPECHPQLDRQRELKRSQTK